jgi:uncharacterized protein (TIGR02117 family)
MNCRAILLGLFLSLAAFRATAEPCREITVVNHGYHTGIIVPLRDFEPHRFLRTSFFNGYQWLEIGWGDADFYQAAGEDVWLGLKALLTPTDAVMHISAFLRPPAERFRAAELVQVAVTEDGYRRLINRLKLQFIRTRDGRVKPIRPGLYGRSYFFRARGVYSIFYTCNSWTAEVLAYAGVKIDQDAAKRASSVMEQLREIGPKRCGPDAGSARP